MNDAPWLLVIAGGVLVSLATVLFLFTLWLGLHKKIWWPLALVSTLWLAAMTLYSVTEMSDQKNSSRYKISASPNSDT